MFSLYVFQQVETLSRSPEDGTIKLPIGHLADRATLQNDDHHTNQALHSRYAYNCPAALLIFKSQYVSSLLVLITQENADTADMI